MVKYCKRFKTLVFVLIIGIIFADSYNKLEGDLNKFLISNQKVSYEIENSSKMANQQGISTTDSAQSDFIYLSDIPYDKSLSKTGWGNTTLDKTTPSDDERQLFFRIKESTVTFKKGR